MCCRSSGASDCTETHWTAAHHDGGEFLAIASVQVLEESASCEVTGREDVGHQDKHFLGNGCGCSHAGGVAERHANVLCLATIDAVGR